VATIRNSLSGLRCMRIRTFATPDSHDTGVPAPLLTGAEPSQGRVTYPASTTPRYVSFHRTRGSIYSDLKEDPVSPAGNDHGVNAALLRSPSSLVVRREALRLSIRDNCLLVTAITLAMTGHRNGVDPHRPLTLGNGQWRLRSGYSDICRAACSNI
jgi:hypothetical protein